MSKVLSNPKIGDIIERMGPLKDPRWTGWRKASYFERLSDGSRAEVHFVVKIENGIWKAVDDFKFK